MKIIKQCFVSFALVLLGLTSCEYNFSNEDNFVELKQPDGNINFSIDISEIPEGETIYLYKSTRLYLKTKGSCEVKFIEFSFNHKKIDHVSNGNSYYVDIPFSNEVKYNQPYLFKVNVVVDSNSGSLADILGIEGYAGELGFYIVFLDNIPDIKLNISKSKTDDNFLKLVWDKPEFDYLEVDHYRILGQNNWETWYIKEIGRVPGNETFFVDPSYFAGEKRYDIEIHFKNDKIGPVVFPYTISTEPIEFSYQYEDISLDKMRLSWTPYSYKCQYVLLSGGLATTLTTSDNSIIIDRIKFPNDNDGYNPYYQMRVIPYTEDESYSHYYDFKHRLHYEADFIDIGGDTKVYDYDNRIIFGVEYPSTNSCTFTFYDLAKMEQIKSHQENRHVQWIECSSTTKEIAITYQDNIRIYNDFTFSSHTDIANPIAEEGILIAKIIDNNRIVIITNKEELYHLHVYDMAKEALAYSIRFETFNRYYYFDFSFSSNGNYCAVKDMYNSKATFYQLNETDYKELYTWYDFAWEWNILFDPLDNETYFITCEGRTDTYNIASQNRTNTYEGIYLTTDLYTKNRVRSRPINYNNNSVIVEITDKDGMNVIGKLPLESYMHPSLIDDVLFVDGYYLNLKPLY